MPNNLVSLLRATDSGLKIVMEKDDLKIHSPKGEILGIGKKVGRLYKLDLSSGDEAYISKAGHTWDEWHRIFGHMYIGSIQLLKRKNMVEGMEVDESIAPSRQCAPCIEAKQHRTPFPRSTNESVQEIGELTVSDVWGPTRIQSIQGNSYYISFTDTKSRRSQIYFMENKSQALQKFKYYKSFMETQKNKKLKILRTDDGGEYVSEDSRIIAKNPASDCNTRHRTHQRKMESRKDLTEHWLSMAKQC